MIIGTSANTTTINHGFQPNGVKPNIPLIPGTVTTRIVKPMEITVE
jgi:hypothetical protein